MKKLLILLGLLLCFAGRSKAQTEIVRFASDPATCDATRGMIYYNTTSNVVKFCSATNTWSSIASTGLPAGPTTPNGLAQVLCSTPVGGVAQPAVYCRPGVSVNTQALGSPYTVAVSDLGNVIKATNAGAGTINVPDGGTSPFTSPSNFAVYSAGAGTVTLTRTSTSQFCLGANACANTQAITTGQVAYLYLDALNNWIVTLVGSGISGLTANTIPVATSATVLGNSIVTQPNTSQISTTIADGGVFTLQQPGVYSLHELFFSGTPISAANPLVVESESSSLGLYLSTSNTAGAAVHMLPLRTDMGQVNTTGWQVGNSAGQNASLLLPFTATASLTAGQVVKVDSANNNSVVVATTGDTGGGIPIGIVVNSPGVAGLALVAVSGVVTTPVLGTGTCTKGQFVIVDTTTNGRVKCSTYTAGTSIGIVTVAQAAVGSTVTMLVQIR